MAERETAKLSSGHVRPGSLVCSESLDFAGIFLHLCLSSPAVVRYNPAQLLGHMLGQRRRGDGAENQPVERAGGGDD
jgi:hypothetical protein